MQMLIGGKFIDKNDKMEIKNPANNEIIDTVPLGSREDAKKAIVAANKAKKTMGNISARKISEILYNIGEQLSKNSSEFAKMITIESGKPIKHSHDEIKRSKETIILSAEESKRIYGEVIPMDACLNGKGIIGFTLKLPLGVVGAITPFNYPVNLAIHKVAPALAAKNAVVLKPSIKAPLAALKFGEMVNEFLPEGAMNVVTGEGSTVGDEIVCSNLVNKISFTGSVDVGLSISKKVGMKKLTLELGGNDPLIVLQDADINEAVDSAAKGSYLVAGQVCIGVKRIILDRRIADEFVDKFVAVTKKLKFGDPMDPKTDVGPLIDEESAIKVENVVNEALSDGAELLCGGKRDHTFYAPTVLDNVDANMRIVQEETFGPVSPIIRVDGIDEAIKIANYTRYGLQASIFTSNINSAMKAAKSIEAGGVLINKQSTYRTDNMPFGGFKMSGMGKEGVKYAVEDMTRSKLVIINTQNI